MQNTTITNDTRTSDTADIAALIEQAVAQLADSTPNFSYGNRRIDRKEDLDEAVNTIMSVNHNVRLSAHWIDTHGQQIGRALVMGNLVGMPFFVTSQMVYGRDGYRACSIAAYKHDAQKHPFDVNPTDYIGRIRIDPETDEDFLEQGFTAHWAGSAYCMPLDVLKTEGLILDSPMEGRAAPDCLILCEETIGLALPVPLHMTLQWRSFEHVVDIRTYLIEPHRVSSGADYANTSKTFDEQLLGREARATESYIMRLMAAAVSPEFGENTDLAAFYDAYCKEIDHIRATFSSSNSESSVANAASENRETTHSHDSDTTAVKDDDASSGHCEWEFEPCYAEGPYYSLAPFFEYTAVKPDTYRLCARHFVVWIEFIADVIGEDTSRIRFKNGDKLISFIFTRIIDWSHPQGAPVAAAPMSRLLLRGALGNIPIEKLTLDDITKYPDDYEYCVAYPAPVVAAIRNVVGSYLKENNLRLVAPHARPREENERTTIWLAHIMRRVIQPILTDSTVVDDAIDKIHHADLGTIRAC